MDLMQPWLIAYDTNNKVSPFYPRCPNSNHRAGTQITRLTVFFFCHNCRSLHGLTFRYLAVLDPEVAGYMLTAPARLLTRHIASQDLLRTNHMASLSKQLSVFEAFRHLNRVQHTPNTTTMSLELPYQLQTPNMLAKYTEHTRKTDRKLKFVVSTGGSGTAHHEATLTACHDTCLLFRVCTLHAARCHGGKRFNIHTLLMQCSCEKGPDVAVCHEELMCS